MKTITIVGWSAKERAVVERITFWPDEMEMFTAVAKAAQVLDLMTIENVLVEEKEKKESEADKLSHSHHCKICNGELDSAGVCHWCKAGRKPPTS